jgi:hypothetical protein
MITFKVVAMTKVNTWLFCWIFMISAPSVPTELPSDSLAKILLKAIILKLSSVTSLFPFL